jgi:hypothetical protein
VVEELGGDDGEMDGILTEDGGPVINQWLAINSMEQLDQFMVSKNFIAIIIYNYFCEFDMESTATIRFLGTTHNIVIRNLVLTHITVIHRIQCMIQCNV